MSDVNSVKQKTTGPRRSQYHKWQLEVQRLIPKVPGKFLTENEGNKGDRAPLKNPKVFRCGFGRYVITGSLGRHAEMDGAADFASRWTLEGTWRVLV